MILGKTSSYTQCFCLTFRCSGYLPGFKWHMLNEGTIYNQLLVIGNLNRDLRRDDLRVSLLAHEGDPGVFGELYYCMMYETLCSLDAEDHVGCQKKIGSTKNSDRCCSQVGSWGSPY